MEQKERLLQEAQKHAQTLFPMACDIFDHPEIGREEVYASSLLTAFLEARGFAVERGIGGMETAFRATWEQGNGGPSIGFLMEYDALRGMGHACGHHLQAPACISAALALRECCQAPFKLVLYGTPDEEMQGGKVTLEKAGYFRDADVMLACHTATRTFISYTNKALAPIRVTFHGTPSHAASAPEKGRSALDAMLLTFHGLEILREHICDGCRIHYTILEGTGASNVVPETAKAHITLRSPDRRYLEDMQRRMENVVRGGCLMTETTADFEYRNVYWNLVPVPTLRRVAQEAAQEAGAQKLSLEAPVSGGSSDVGNVSWVVPTVVLNTYYDDADGHSREWMEKGKTEQAQSFLIRASRSMALTGCMLLENPSLLQTIQEEHKQNIGEKQV